MTIRQLVTRKINERVRWQMCGGFNVVVFPEQAVIAFTESHGLLVKYPAIIDCKEVTGSVHIPADEVRQAE